MDWESKLRDMIVGPFGRTVAATNLGPNTIATGVSDAAALAVVTIIRGRGEYIGELRHSSISGRSFREEFLGRSVPAALRTNLDIGTLLTGRAFLGLQHSGYPSWG